MQKQFQLHLLETLTIDLNIFNPMKTVALRLWNQPTNQVQVIRMEACNVPEAQKNKTSQRQYLSHVDFRI